MEPVELVKISKFDNFLSSINSTQDTKTNIYHKIDFF